MTFIGSLSFCRSVRIWFAFSALCLSAPSNAEITHREYVLNDLNVFEWPYVYDSTADRFTLVISGSDKKGFKAILHRFAWNGETARESIYDRDQQFEKVGEIEVIKEASLKVNKLRIRNYEDNNYGYASLSLSSGLGKIEITPSLVEINTGLHKGVYRDYAISGKMLYRFRGTFEPNVEVVEEVGSEGGYSLGPWRSGDNRETFIVVYGNEVREIQYCDGKPVVFSFPYGYERDDNFDRVRLHLQGKLPMTLKSHLSGSCIQLLDKGGSVIFEKQF